MRLKSTFQGMPKIKCPEAVLSVVRRFTAPRDDAPLAFLPVAEESDQNISDRIKIPVNSASLKMQADAEIREQGQFLARQDLWEELSQRIRAADQSRAVTRSGAPIAELLLFGGRADVVSAAEHALLHGRPAKGSHFFAGIEDMEMLLVDAPEDYALALVVAHMHIDIGWAWRGHGPDNTVSDANREAFHAHFARAEEILDGFSAHELNSAALCSARCALLPASENAADLVSDDFEDLIDLDPENPRHMRALGTYLLPQWYGSHEKLDLEARRTAARTYDLWRAGAYAWVWFDAVLTDPVALKLLDADYFLDGIDDILERHRDQETANLVCAQLYCAWQAARKNYIEGLCDGEQAAQLRKGFEQAVQNHLRELHPLVWGHAEIGFDNRNRSISMDRLATQGRELALNAVAQPFLKAIEDGLTIHFGPEGITQIQP